jgi:hypothetical protein
MNSDLQPDMRVVDLVQFSLEAHGIASAIDGSIVRLSDGSDLSFEPRVFDGPPNDRVKIIQLDMVVRSPRIAHRYIVESMAGMGEDQAKAEREAFVKFMMGPFHVLLTALGDHTCESNPAQWLKWKNSSASWRICDGPLLFHNTAATETAYPEFIQQLENLFLASASRDVHWVRVFLASFSGAQTGGEVLLDNQPWPEAVELLNSQQWDFPQEYRSLRHFFVALPA